MAFELGIYHFGELYVPQKEMLTSIELLGTEVAPVVRKEIASRQEAAGGQQ